MICNALIGNNLNPFKQNIPGLSQKTCFCILYGDNRIYLFKVNHQDDI